MAGFFSQIFRVVNKYSASASLNILKYLNISLNDKLLFIALSCFNLYILQPDPGILMAPSTQIMCRELQITLLLCSLLVLVSWFHLILLILGVGIHQEAR